MKTRLLYCVCAIVALLVPWASAQTKDIAAQFESKKFALQVGQSQRHLVYGLELRKQALTTQAAAEIILAVSRKPPSPGHAFRD